MALFASKKIVGIDIGAGSVKVAELAPYRGSFRLKRFGVQSLPNAAVNGGEIVQVETVAQAIRSALSGARISIKSASSGLWGNSVVVKKISMPRIEARLVAEQVKWEAEQYIPFDINEISLEHCILKGSSSPEAMDVLLVAAKQEFIFRYLEAIEMAGLKCKIMDVTGFALANCFVENYGKQAGLTALLNIGASTSNLVVVSQGEPVFTRDVAVGGSVYTNEIHKIMGVSLEEAEALKLSASYGQGAPDEVIKIIQSTNETVVEEIRSAFDFFAATSSDGTFNHFYATGGGIYTPGLMDAISKATNMGFEVFNPFQKMSFDSSSISKDFAAQIKAICGVAMGLGMRRVGE